jgi:hypothetical protein
MRQLVRGRFQVAMTAAALVLLAGEVGFHPVRGGSECDPDGGCAPVTPFERMLRAGKPYCISRLAHPSNGPCDFGYYVGGGAPICGDERCPLEGTWGWDYALCFSRVRLTWYHGRHYQGGEGQYQPNGCITPLKSFLVDRP